MLRLTKPPTNDYKPRTAYLEINMDTETLIEAVKMMLLVMTDTERQEFFDRVSEGFCRSCGSVIGINSVCYCNNDE